VERPTPTAVVHDLVATDHDLTLTVSFAPIEVAPGGSLRIDIVVRNDRLVPVVLAGPCGDPSMSAMVPVPVHPVGRDWIGIAGRFKAFALKQGLGPIDHPEATVRSLDAIVTCDSRGSDTLGPGGSVSATLRWTAEFVKGIPVPPEDIPVSIGIGHASPGGPSGHPPDVNGSTESDLRIYQRLAVDGVIHVVGAAPRLVTAGQAVDALLADRRFAAWLGEKPMSTWSGANLFLIDYGAAQGIVPAGPSWEIDLFREVGVPRNWAIGFVDPFTGRLSKASYCNIPCDR
jgi:hypothetical protein